MAFKKEPLFCPRVAQSSFFDGSFVLVFLGAPARF
jgi:hypothetical protein